MAKASIQFQTENRDAFFRRVHVFVLPYHEGALRVARAYAAAKEAFRTVKRKRGERYFEHCRFVALILIDKLGIYDPDMIIAALLHDIVEDCDPEWTIERVLREFGARVAKLVAALTIPSGEFANREERLHAYHTQLFAGPPEALIIKLADRLHNLSSCGALSWDAQKRMIEETEHVYLPLAKEKSILAEELKEVIAKRKEEMMHGPTDP